MTKSHAIFDHPVFNLGFRVFFALAGLSALILLVLWSAIFKGTLTQANYFSNTYWHAHEMLMGYSVAVIAGFLLTAVKNWTGKSTVTGKPLAILALVWLYGRVVPFYEGVLPDALIALVDFAFLPMLAYQVSKPILQARQYSNLIFVGLLLVLALANGLIHSEILGLQKNTAAIGIQVIMATIIVLILIIAGRVLPFFTHRGISAALVVRNPVLDAVAIASAMLVFDLQMLGTTGILLALVAMVAALANLARVYQWHIQKIWYVPLLWVLYTGYGWLILGFLLTALAAFGLVLPSVAVHAFSIGGIGVLTVGMMARVSLGHTGRAMRVSNAIVIAFVLINLAAVFRVLLPIAVPAWYGSFVYIAMLLWLAAFALFVAVYLPMLTSVRADGEKG
jgi:uncharacterized protein involved in response to NO